MEAQDSASLARALRERIYATIATLVSLIALADHLDAEPSSRITIPLWITLFGLWSASMFADIAAYLASHGALPAWHEVREMVRVSGQHLACGVVPTALFLISGAGLFGLDRALDLAIVGQIGTLAVVVARGTQRDDPNGIEDRHRRRRSGTWAARGRAGAGGAPDLA